MKKERETMQTNSKYSEIEISNIEVIKFLDIASCYIILAVIMAKTEKRIKNFFYCSFDRRFESYVSLSVCFCD